MVCSSPQVSTKKSLKTPQAMQSHGAGLDLSTKNKPSIMIWQMMNNWSVFLLIQPVFNALLCVTFFLHSSLSILSSIFTLSPSENKWAAKK